MSANKGISTEEVVRAFAAEGGNFAAVARRLGITRSTAQHHLRKAGMLDKPLAGGRVQERQRVVRALPPKGQIFRYIISSAQSCTKVHPQVVDNIEALADYYGAEIIVGRFTYNQNAFGRLSVKPGTEKKKESELWYDPALEFYYCDDHVQLAPGLVYCGEMNTLPTAGDPLSGFEAYTGRSSGIFPHVKLAKRSIPSDIEGATKFNYTTGTLTQRNYIQKTAGLKAEFHHVYGALLVEVDDQGNWWVRQLNADSKARIYDLTLLVDKGVVYDVAGEGVEAINWGDVHLEWSDPVARRISWGPGGVLDLLRPRYQFMHDLVDPPRNHHDMKDPHRQFEQFCEGRENMQGMMQNVATFLGEESYRDFCETVVVESNHDAMVERWLREADYRKDPVNAIFFLELQLQKYKAIRAKDKRFHLCEWAARHLGCPEDVRWLRLGDPFIICPDAKEGIQCTYHGHKGPRGAKGTPRAFARMGRRVNVGHVHGSGIWDSVYAAGTMSLLTLPYSVGAPSDWSHTIIITYPNGKRALATYWAGKPWAEWEG